ncbi:MAG: UbiA family prenyltransferase [Candidatus Poribacteria bacterium]
MLKDKIKAYLELIRYPLFPIPIVTTLQGVLLANNGIMSWKGYIAIVVSMMGYFAGMMKNDYFHSPTDALSTPQKPIPSERVSPRNVFIFASSMYVICLFLGFLMNYKAGLVVVLLIVFSHLYNAIFKGKGILGSIVLPLGIAGMSVFGSIAVSGKIPEILWYGVIGVFLFDFGAHIATTFKDIDHDRSAGIVTTPIQIGIKPALFLSTLATILAYFAFVLPYAVSKAEPNYLIWAGIAFGATFITRIPLLFRQTQDNGYLALKGALLSCIVLYPCLIGIVLPVPICAVIILTPFILSLILLEFTAHRV